MPAVIGLFRVSRARVTHVFAGPRVPIGRWDRDQGRELRRYFSSFCEQRAYARYAPKSRVDTSHNLAAAARSSALGSGTTGLHPVKY